MYPVPKLKKKLRCIGISSQITFPCGFFDGVASRSIGDASFVLLMGNTHSLNFFMVCGLSTNTKEELLSLLELLAAAKLMGIPFLNIFGDSLVIINWENNVASLDLPCLDQWCEDIRSLMNSFSHLTIKHIYHEHNQ